MKRILVACLMACASCQSGSAPETKPKVLVSIPPFAALVNTLAGEAVEVQLLVPPGSSPHDFEPTPRDIERATSAKLWLRLGEPFEEKIAALFKSRALDVTETMELLPADEEHAHGGFDRHIWLSPKVSLVLVEKFSTELQKLLPAHAEEIKAHAETLNEELQAYDREFKRLLQPYQGRFLITSHPAFGYLCRDYGLIQISLESEGKETTARQVEGLCKQISRDQVLGIVTEGQYGSRAARYLGERLEIQTRSIDPYALTYLEGLSNLLKELVGEE